MRRFLCAILLTVFAAACVAPADAAMQLKIEDGSANMVTIVDNGAGDTSPLDGFIVWSGNMPSWSAIVSAGASKPHIGSAVLPQMDLSVQATSTAADSLTVILEDTDFVGAVPPDVYGFQTAIGGTTMGTVNVESYVDDSNADFGTSEVLSFLGPFSGGAFSGSANALTSAPEASLYSLTLAVILDHGDGNLISSYNAGLTPLVPEPSSVLVWSLMGLGALVVGVRRRRMA